MQEHTCTYIYIQPLFFSFFFLSFEVDFLGFTATILFSIYVMAIPLIFQAKAMCVRLVFSISLVVLLAGIIITLFVTYESHENFEASARRGVIQLQSNQSLSIDFLFTG
ncbi:hypothetical protein ABFS83_04G196600 [Erythranthe nasuta]